MNKGYDLKFGARPLRRSIQRYVEDPLAEAILSQQLCEGDHVSMSFEGGSELTIETRRVDKEASPEEGAIE